MILYIIQLVFTRNFIRIEFRTLEMEYKKFIFILVIEKNLAISRFGRNR